MAEATLILVGLLALAYWAMAWLIRRLCRAAASGRRRDSNPSPPPDPPGRPQPPSLARSMEVETGRRLDALERRLSMLETLCRQISAELNRRRND